MKEEIDNIIEHFAEINEEENYIWGHDTAIETVEEAREFIKKELNKIYNQALEDLDKVKFDEDRCYIDYKGNIDFKMIKYEIINQLKKSEGKE